MNSGRWVSIWIDGPFGGVTNGFSRQRLQLPVWIGGTLDTGIPGVTYKIRMSASGAFMTKMILLVLLMDYIQTMIMILLGLVITQEQAQNIIDAAAV